MNSERTLGDICNDINQSLEEYERDKKQLNHTKLNELKEELLNSLIINKDKEERVNSSFIELVSHLKETTIDTTIEWQYAPLYNDLLAGIYEVVPAIQSTPLPKVLKMTYKKINEK